MFTWLHRPRPLHLGRAALLATATASSLFFAQASCSPGAREPHIIVSRPTVPPGVLTSYSVAALNVAVYLLWKVPSASLQRVMTSYFLSGGDIPRSRAAVALSPLLCVFSHNSLWHLAFNMIGLTSFSPHLMDGRERATRPKLSPAEYLAMFCAAGTVGSVASATFTRAVGLPRPGLGSSGGIFAILTFYALAYPDARVMAFFVLNMSAQTAVAGVSVSQARKRCIAAGAAHYLTRPPKNLTHPTRRRRPSMWACA